MYEDAPEPFTREWLTEELTRSEAARAEFPLAGLSGAVAYTLGTLNSGQHFLISELLLSALALGAAMSVRALIRPWYTRRSIYVFYTFCFVVAVLYGISPSKT